MPRVNDANVSSFEGAMSRIRKGQVAPFLPRAEFRERFYRSYFDPAFDVELQAMAVLRLETKTALGSDYRGGPGHYLRSVTVIATESLSKRFPRVTALDRLSVDVGPGVTGLVGAMGGLGGFFPPLLLGFSRDRLGVIWPGFILLAAVSAGLWVLNARVFDAYPPDTTLDLATIYQDLLHRGQLAAYEVQQRCSRLPAPVGNNIATPPMVQIWVIPCHLLLASRNVPYCRVAPAHPRKAAPSFAHTSGWPMPELRSPASG